MKTTQPKEEGQHVCHSFQHLVSTLWQMMSPGAATGHIMILAHKMPTKTIKSFELNIT